MCGICGIFEKNKNNSLLIKDMLKLIEHRGPDDSAIFSENDVTLGHRRLAIIDLISGNQPIFNENKTLAIIFNGEIYNHLELRQQLSANHLFQTKSDTEVILHAFEEWGYDSFSKLNGIFAFCIYDLTEKTLILVRDQFGVKPLHYHHQNNLFIFSSEQKPILIHPRFERSINKEALHQQLNLRYTQSSNTLFNGIKRLPPASYLIYENNSIKIRKYWNLTPTTDHSLNESNISDKINFYIKQAVNRQLISDVPIGVFSIFHS